MKKINLAITGCMGRMGQQIIKSAKSDKNFRLVALTENIIVNKKIAGIKPSLNSEQAFKKSNLIIDFTVPKCTFEVLKIASKLKKRVVIGTTGFSKKEEFLIKFSSFLENPVVPITTLFLSFDAIFKTSNVHLGTVKSIIKLAFLNACSAFKLGLIPLIFLLITLFSVRATILKFLSDLADLIIC